MNNAHIYQRFQDAFSNKAHAAADEKPTQNHGLHMTLASVHKAVFAPHVKTLEEAKDRFQAILDMTVTEKPEK